MNLEDLRITAQLHIGVSMEQPFARRYANEALIQLCNMYPMTVMRKKKAVLTDVVSGEETELPADCYMLYKVKRYGETINEGYELVDQHIEFDANGEYELVYYARPTMLNAESDVPEVPEPFHPCIALFIGAREKFRLFGEEDVDSIRLMREFAETAGLADSFVNKRGRKRIIKAQEWR